MPRPRDPKRNEAFEIWKNHEGNITNRAIAEQLGISEKTVGGWKSKDNWTSKSNGVLQTKIRSTPKRKGGGQPGNKNALGNSGGAPKQNTNSLKHGLFAKYLPKETLEIVYQLGNASPADLIWMNIELMFAKILRAEQIMFVESKDDMTKELKRVKQTDTGQEVEYELQFAWDKHASFLQATAKAMNALQGLFKQFDEIANKHDERRLKLEQMKLNVEKTKAEIDNLNDDGTDDTVNIVITRKEARD
ncbi:phage terminase small subunit [Fredinandcohnia humi]